MQVGSGPEPAVTLVWDLENIHIYKNAKHDIDAHVRVVEYDIDTSNGRFAVDRELIYGSRTFDLDHEAL